MKNLIKAGIIGCGHLGKLHLKNIKEIEQRNQLVKLEGLHDTDTEMLRNLSQESGVRYYERLDDMLNDVNAVFIVTPTTTHFSIAEKTISAGIHTFIEKPVTETVEEAAGLERIKKAGTIVQVGHIERFNPAILSVEKYTLAPLFIETHRLAQFNPRGTDVSVIKDLMIHDIDIILNLVKSGVRNIEANGVGVLTDTIDIANSRINFENGCVANITASRISLKKMRKMRIFQKNAYVSIDFLNNTSEVFRLSEDTESNIFSVPVNLNGRDYKIAYDKPVVDITNAMKYEEELFFNSIMHNQEPEVSLRDGKIALEIAAKIIDKIESNMGLLK
ncbi:MAG TPA: Gfo/Idh/MocA family oxidoreductase [Ignavibacteria bacterium]|nr:Gfo/Idh/MocA family oxidoreductase [Ignavibacteria bacterium]